MKKSKKNYAIVILIVILLALSIGYAAFSTTLNINGTATATANWDVKFTTGTINEAGHGSNPTISADGKTMTVAATLSFPGDACTVTANIKNSGSIAAKLTGFELTATDGSAFSSDDIDVVIPTIKTDGTEVIAPNETCPVTFSIKWKTASEETSATANFKITFTYEQDTTEVNPTPAHGTHE